MSPLSLPACRQARDAFRDNAGANERQFPARGILSRFISSFGIFCREFGSLTRYRGTVNPSSRRPAPVFSLFTATADAAATVLIWQLVSFPRRFVPRCHPADLKSVKAIWILPTSHVELPLSVRLRARARAWLVATGMVGGRDGAGGGRKERKRDAKQFARYDERLIDLISAG
jgi:hypothetical protein